MELVWKKIDRGHPIYQYMFTTGTWPRDFFMFVETARHCCDHQPQEIAPLAPIAKACGSHAVNTLHINSMGKLQDSAWASL